MIQELDDQISAIVTKYITEECKKGDSYQLPSHMDARAFGKFYWNYDCIIVPAANRKSLDYYGGFEYIDSDYVKQYGDYVIYSAEADRVQEVLEALFDSEEMADA